MRSLPMFLRLAEEMTRIPYITPFPSSLFNLFFNEPTWLSMSRAVSWNQAVRFQKNEFTPLKVGKNGYQVSVDVSDFKPSELTVKTVDNSVVIEGKSEDHEDGQGNYMLRQFVRRFALPKGYEAEKAVSTLSSDGVLTISIPNLQTTENERTIPIQHTYTTDPAYLNIKENPPLEENSPSKSTSEKNK